MTRLITAICLHAAIFGLANPASSQEDSNQIQPRLPDQISFVHIPFIYDVDSIWIKEAPVIIRDTAPFGLIASMVDPIFVKDPSSGNLVDLNLISRSKTTLSILKESEEKFVVQINLREFVQLTPTLSAQTLARLIITCIRMTTGPDQGEGVSINIIGPGGKPLKLESEGEILW